MEIIFALSTVLLLRTTRISGSLNARNFNSANISIKVKCSDSNNRAIHLGQIKPMNDMDLMEIENLI